LTDYSSSYQLRLGQINILQRIKMASIRTNLRPDYYEFFPVFTEIELKHRVARLPFHLATLLGLRNVVLASRLSNGEESLRTFLAMNHINQRELLSDVLAFVGIQGTTVAAIRKVPRERFALASYQPFSYLNHFLPFDSTSCVTAPGLVALMIDRLQVTEGLKILEVGIGSGYHAACISEATNRQTYIIGVERAPTYARFGNRVLRELKFTNIDIVVGDASSRLFAKEVRFDRVYVTSAEFTGPPDVVRSMLTSGGRLQFVRGISQQEFQSEPAESWLKSKYGRYDQYRSADWRKYCCLSTHNSYRRKLHEIDRVFDVTFTPYIRSRELYNDQTEDPFSEIRAFL
jgi:protein-L-isoaspartate(D-aspartate) O-methyltransferase